MHGRKGCGFGIFFVARCDQDAAVNELVQRAVRQGLKFFDGDQFDGDGPTLAASVFTSGPNDKSPGVAKAPTRGVPSFTLTKDTPVHLKVVKTVSSATARVGDPVELEVSDDVLVEGVPVLIKGAKVSGVIADAEPRKRFGHNGKLAFSISSLTLADGEQAPLRSYEEAPGSWSSSSVAISSKDVAIPQNTEYTVLIDGDVHLKREAFEVPKNRSAAAPEPPSPATPQR